MRPCAAREATASPNPNDLNGKARMIVSGWDKHEPEPEVEDTQLVNDLTALYMRDMGRVALLTVDEERVLARRMELARHQTEMERELGLQFEPANVPGPGVGPSAEPAAWEGAMLLLARIAQNGDAATAVADHLGLDDAPTLDSIATLPQFRAAIDDVVHPELAERVGHELGLTVEDAHRALSSCRWTPGCCRPRSQ